MMEADSQMQRILKQKFFSWTLSLAWIAMHGFFIQDAAARSEIHLRGEIGGNLTFRCPVDNSRSIKFFYFQRNDDFINGFHFMKEIPTKTWSNTKMDEKDKTTVHMFNLNASHGGDYECLIQYNDSRNKTVIKVNVTANYSKPQPYQECFDGKCVVHCSSHGGYPSIQITWDVLETDVWKLENHTEVTDPETMTVNSSSAASFNCSNGELSSIRCCVGDITSDLITVCKPQSGTMDLLMKIAISAACLAFILVVVLFSYCCKHNRKKRGTAKEAQEDLVGERSCLKEGMPEHGTEQNEMEFAVVECEADL